MTILLEIINTTIYSLAVLGIGELFLGYRVRNSKYKWYILGISVCVLSCTMLYANLGVRTIVHVLCCIILISTWFDETRKNVLGLYIGSTIVLSMLSMLLDVIFTELVESLNISMLDEFIRIANITLLWLMVRVLGRYYSNKYPIGLRSLGAGYWVLFVLILLFDASILLPLGDFILNVLDVERQYLTAFFYWCVVIGILLQIVLLINALVTRNVHKDNEKLAKQFLENQKEHYLYLEKREQETKKFRHDVKNHLLVLESLISNQDYDEAERYLNTLSERVGSFNNRICVNNGIADAILNKFDAKAQENGIILNVKGHFPLDCYIAAYDICTVLSNLLSNAIEAEVASKGKEVKVELKYISDKVFIVVENDYQHKLERVDDTFKSTKTDAIGHGYGLSNVTECVEKNGGYVSISTENNRFKVMIMMLNEKEGTE